MESLSVSPALFCLLQRLKRGVSTVAMSYNRVFQPHGTLCFRAWNTLFQSMEHCVSRHETLCFICGNTAFSLLEQTGKKL